MRSFSSLALIAATTFSLATFATNADAGIVTDENGKPGIAGGWAVRDDGTANGAGLVDVYPASWSIKPGDPVQLKVRASAGYDVRVMRLGWYGGQGAREITTVTGRPANPQPYPVADAKYGLAEAKWAVTDTIATDASWVPGIYVARVEESDGKDAETFFVVRDDGLAQKQPILLVVGTNTHQAYNCWPGPDKGGKSLYGFNSSAAHPSDDITGLTQAVKVSYDRPFFVGGGTADLANYEYPFVRWAEKNGWEIAYATDLDLHRDPNLAKGRRAVVFSGHEEYTSWEMFDNALAARDSGSNFLFLTGDTWSWQVRFEAGPAGPTSTMVGYKENWPHDPEQVAGVKARNAGNIAEAKAHFQKATRGWKNLENDATSGIDVRRPGMLLTGVMSAGVIRDAAGHPMSGGDFPYGDLFVDAPDFWIFQGTGLQRGDKLPDVFGYEVDSTMKGTAEMDPYRPQNQVKFGTIKEISDGAAKGAAGYYQKDLGGDKRVEVIAMSAIYFSWALDDWAAKASGKASAYSPIADKMMMNVLSRWTSSTPIPPVTPPADQGGNDNGSYDPEKQGDGATGASTDPAPGHKTGCSYTVAPAQGDAVAGAACVIGLGLLAAARVRRRALARGKGRA